jgi:hypothetical protein
VGRKSEGKPPVVRNVEITEDGCIIVEFDRKLAPAFFHTTKAIFEPEALFGLVQDFGMIPTAAETDFPGLPIVTEEAMMEDEDEEEDTKGKKKGEGK